MSKKVWRLWISWLLVMVLMFSMTGCGSDDQKDPTETEAETQDDSDSSDDEEPAPTEEPVYDYFSIYTDYAKAVRATNPNIKYFSIVYTKKPVLLVTDSVMDDYTDRNYNPLLTAWHADLYSLDAASGNVCFVKKIVGEEQGFPLFVYEDTIVSGTQNYAERTAGINGIGHVDKIGGYGYGTGKGLIQKDLVCEGKPVIISLKPITEEEAGQQDYYIGFYGEGEFVSFEEIEPVENAETITIPQPEIKNLSDLSPSEETELKLMSVGDILDLDLDQVDEDVLQIVYADSNKVVLRDCDRLFVYDLVSKKISKAAELSQMEADILDEDLDEDACLIEAVDDHQFWVHKLRGGTGYVVDIQSDRVYKYDGSDRIATIATEGYPIYEGVNTVYSVDDQREVYLDYPTEKSRYKKVNIVLRDKGTKKKEKYSFLEGLSNE